MFLARAREVLLDPAPLNVLVWVTRPATDRRIAREMGRVLVEDRTVSTWLWDTDLGADRRGVRDSRRLGEPFRSGSSHPGASPESGPTTRTLDLTPDLVLLNYGHGGTADEVSSQLDTLLAAITDRWADCPPC